MDSTRIEEKIDTQDELTERLRSAIGNLVEEMENYKAVLKAAILVALVERTETNDSIHQGYINTVIEFLKEH